MSENSNATAMQTTSGLDQEGGKLSVLGQMTPEVFEAQIKREEQMREVLKDYVKRNMKDGYHYSSDLGGTKLAKPMLLQEGSRNICSLLKLFFGEPVIDEKWLEGDHYRVRAHVGLFNAEGRQITSGDGICSTRETKYAYRKGERECPNCHSTAIIKGKAQYGGGWLCFDKKGGCGTKFSDGDPAIEAQVIGRVDNPDKADIENTVLKMAVKRAKSAAVCDVPMVSEIFAPEGDPPKAAEEGSRKDAKTAKAETGGQDARGPVAAEPANPIETAAVLGEINNLFLVKCGDGVNIDVEEAKKFLKGRDPSVMPIDALRKLLAELQAL
jgi:hypothetical protein